MIDKSMRAIEPLNLNKRDRKAIKEKRVKDFGKVTEIEITEEDLVDPNVLYDFYASYWVKLPKPTFGTHFIELGQDEIIVRKC